MTDISIYSCESMLSNNSKLHIVYRVKHDDDNYADLELFGAAFESWNIMDRMQVTYVDIDLKLADPYLYDALYKMAEAHLEHLRK